MNDNDYELIELKSPVPSSIEDAVERGIDRAHKTVKNLSWFRVGDMRGKIDQGKVPHWQVSIKVGFTVKKRVRPRQHL